jgi:hypothetical protein
LKLFDYFEVCLLGFSSSCSLNNLLKANGEEVKSSSGAQAVQWAAEKKWKLLEDYCMQDTILTHCISVHSFVCIPLTGWAKPVWCRKRMYEQRRRKSLLQRRDHAAAAPGSDAVAAPGADAATATTLELPTSMTFQC